MSSIRSMRLAEHFIGLALALSVTIISFRTIFWNGPNRAKIRTWGFRIAASSFFLTELFLVVLWLDENLSDVASPALDMVETIFGSIVDISLTLVLGLTLTEIIPPRLRAYGLAGVVILYPLIILTTLIECGIYLWYDGVRIHAAATKDENTDPFVIIPAWISAEATLRILEGTVFLISSAAMLVVSNRIRADRLAVYLLHFALGFFWLGCLIQGILDSIMGVTDMDAQGDSDNSMHYIGQWAYTIFTPLGMHVLAASARRGLDPHPSLTMREALSPRRIWHSIAHAYTRANGSTYIADAQTPEWDEPFSADMSSPYDDWRDSTQYDGGRLGRHSTLTEMSELPVEPAEVPGAELKPELGTDGARVRVHKVDLSEDGLPLMAEMGSPEIGDEREERRGLISGSGRGREAFEPGRFERQITLHGVGEERYR